MTHEQLIIWAAGLFDGEGCVSINPQKEKYTLSLIVQMTHKECVERFWYIFRAGSVWEAIKAKAYYKRQYRYEAWGKSATVIARQLLPYAFVKKPHLEIAVEYGEKCLTTGKRMFSERLTERAYFMRQILYEELRELNKKGTP